jgi:hypothetical protein
VRMESLNRLAGLSTSLDADTAAKICQDGMEAPRMRVAAFHVLSKLDSAIADSIAPQLSSDPAMGHLGIPVPKRSSQPLSAGTEAVEPEALLQESRWSPVAWSLAIQKLVETRAPHAIKRVIAAVKDAGEDIESRCQAAVHLARADAALAGELLIDLYRELPQSDSGRLTAIEAIGVLRLKQAVPLLEAVFTQERVDSLLSTYTAIALARIGGQRALSVLAKSFTSSSATAGSVASALAEYAVESEENWRTIRARARDCALHDGMLRRIAAMAGRRACSLSLEQVLRLQQDRRRESTGQSSSTGPKEPVVCEGRQVALAVGREAQARHRGLEQEHIMLAFLEHWRASGCRPSLREAEEWAKAKGYQTSKSSLQKTTAYKNFRQTHGSKREFRVEKSSGNKAHAD